MNECLFCQIAAGEISGHVVFHDEVAAGFLDTRPVFHGHLLVIPVQHVATLTDLDGAAVGPYFLRVQAATRAVQAAVGADGSFVAVNNTISQSVPHLHTHVVPRRRKDGLRGFFWPRTRYPSDADAAATASAIRAAYIAP